MKYITKRLPPWQLFVGFLLFGLLAEECRGQCEVESNKKDDFTGVVTKQLKMKNIGKGKQLFAVAVKIDSVVLFYFMGPSLGCTTPNESKAYIKFTDESVIEALNINKIDCSGTPLLVIVANYFKDDLSKKPASKIRLVGTEGSFDAELKDPNYFIEAFRCLD